MNVIQQLRAELWAIEPNLVRVAANASLETIPQLRAIVLGDPDARVRANATLLASLIDPTQSIDLIKHSQNDEDAVVRIAAANALRNLPSAMVDEHIEILRKLLEDPSHSVRKFAIYAASQHKLVGVKNELDQISRHDSLDYLRTHAAGALRSLSLQ